MTLLLFLLILSILVFVHELGHFLMAKKNGILVEEFGFGLPPKVWGKKIGETIYSVNLLPIGGFVKLYGEDGEEKSKVKSQKSKAGRAFFEKSIFQRLSVILAGVVMNFLLATIVFSALYYISGIPVETGKVKIIGLIKDSPAETMGLKVDDQILAVDDEEIKRVESFVGLVKEKAGQAVRLEIKREKDNPCLTNQKVFGGAVGPDFESNCRGGNLLISVIPRENPPEGQGPLGVAISEVEMKRFALPLMVIYGVREGFKESIGWGKMILNFLGQSLKSLLKGQIPKEVAGPIGIYQATGMVAQSGILALLEFLGILSVNLAIVNILPFPALDGGRLLFLGIEAFLGKKVAPRVEAWINSAGMAILLLLVLLVTINDVARILIANNFWEKLKVIF